MPTRRVYLPVSPEALAALVSTGELGPTPLAANAVTSALGRPGLTVDEEELEHEAWAAAAEAASDLSVGGSRRRVIASADVDSANVLEGAGSDPASVTLGAKVPLRRIVSFHVDEHAGGREVTDLLWYDVTELPDVARLVDTD